MADMMRRGLLGGALVAGALGVAGRASAQNAPQADPDAEKVQQALQGYNDPAALKVVPVGQDWANLHRYHAANATVAAWTQDKRRVVFMGDSITDNWFNFEGDWFDANGLVGRGISGQTTAQMLVRFWPEVVKLNPQAVHIMAGTNDIAENLDPYDQEATQNNLEAMAAMADANGIAVVMASVPPATSFSWRPEVGNPHDKIVALNTWIQAMCNSHGLAYCDYWPVLANADGGLKTELGIGGDSVHPSKDGYDLMQPLALTAIATALTA